MAAASPAAAGSSGGASSRTASSFIIDGRRESFVIEHATSDMICLQAVVHAGAAPLTVEYDSATRSRFVGAQQHRRGQLAHCR